MDLESVVTGDNKDQPTASGEINAWKKKTYKALNYIIESCELEAQLKIRSATSAAQAWKILQDNYQGKTRTHLCHLFYGITSL